MKLLVLSLFLAFAGCLGTSYEGYKILRVTPDSSIVQQALDGFVLKNADVSFLNQGRKLSSSDVLVGPKSYQNFLHLMEAIDGHTTIITKDVQQLINEEHELNKLAKAKSKINPSAKIDHSYYRTLDEINAEIDTLEATYPSLFSSSTIGTTYEGRNVRLSKISSTGDNSLPVIWIDCGIHAREWVSPASCLYFLDQLKEYGNDAEVTSLLDAYDFLVITVTNPDGYEFTWSDDRLWRKNRFPSSGGLCVGVDLNRNFDSDFGGPGTSSNACSDLYHGVSAFSELESQAVRGAILALGSRAKGFFTLHAYSQYWMTPYGYTSDLPADFDEMMRVTAIGVTALESVYGTQFTYGNIADVIYLAAGGSTDWTYDSAGIVYSFALELRDTGAYGFVLPPEQIEPTATETWEGIKAAINAFA